MMNISGICETTMLGIHSVRFTAYVGESDKLLRPEIMF